MPIEYSEELVELVAEATERHHIESGNTDAMGNSPCACGQWWDSDQGPGWDEHMAEVTLAALSSAGRLVPEGSEVREEWGVQLAHQSGHGTWDRGSAFVEVYDDQADADQLTAYMASVCDGRPVRTMRRIAAYGPWIPAEPAQRSGVAAQEKP